MKKKLIFILLIIMFSLCSCSRNKPITKSDFLLDTYVSVSVYDKKHEKLIDDAFALIKDYEKLLSKSNNESDIKLLENNRYKLVEVSEHTLNIIKIYKNLYEISGRKLDCTIGSLSGLWDFKNNEVPNDKQINTAKNEIGLDKLIIENNKAMLSSDKIMLDFGAVAKGYISDCIKSFLIENGVENAVLNFGGNVVTIGSKPDGSNYNIGIQLPLKNSNEIITSVLVADKAVITAGVYERYIETNNTTYHHILDPFTGYSVKSDLLSATVICDDGAIGDAYSTICILLGKEKALELINNTKGLEAILVDKEMNIFYSNEAFKYIKKE